MTTETQEEKQKEAILKELAKLGGKLQSEDEIVFSGTQFTVPEMYRGDLKGAITFLDRFRQQQEEETAYSRSFRFRPWDVAAAFERAVRRVTGTTGIGRATFSFFGKNPPERRTIPIGVNETMDVPWGVVETQLGVAHLHTIMDEEYGPLGAVQIEAPRKYRHEVQGLFAVIQDELEQRSIYRGQAIDGKDMPDFLPLMTDEEIARIVYSRETAVQLQTYVWAPITQLEVLKAEGTKTKLAVAFTGDYGTGKTESGRITQRKSVDAGRTFIMCRPGRDDLERAVQTARLYQPSVVYFEDVDTVADKDSEKINRILDLFDGIQAKDTEILMVMTTNHIEKVHKGMLRPGRLDAVISFGSLDDEGIKKLIDVTVNEDLLNDIDYEQVAHSMRGFVPAFVREAIDRAIRYAVVRSGGRPDELHTDDFVNAAEGLRPQLELMQSAGEGAGPDRFGDALKREISDAVHGSEIRDYDGDQIGHGMVVDASKDDAIK